MQDPGGIAAEPGTQRMHRTHDGSESCCRAPRQLWATSERMGLVQDFQAPRRSAGCSARENGRQTTDAFGRKWRFHFGSEEFEMIERYDAKE